MGRIKKTLEAVSASDLIAIACLVKAIPISAIKASMRACSKVPFRKRKLSIQFLIYYVIVLSIFFRHSTSDVLKYILNGMSDILPDESSDAACEAAISQGRTRLGEDVMHILFNNICQPLL